MGAQEPAAAAAGAVPHMPISGANRRSSCDHVLDDGNVPGWPIRCLTCGRMWRRGPDVGRAARRRHVAASPEPPRTVHEPLTEPI